MSMVRGDRIAYILIGDTEASCMGGVRWQSGTRPAFVSWRRLYASSYSPSRRYPMRGMLSTKSGRLGTGSTSARRSCIKR